MHKCQTEVLVFGFLAGQTELEEDEDVWLQKPFNALYVRQASLAMWHERN